jgi:lipopolysaccharide transport system ATP-binding protein
LPYEPVEIRLENVTQRYRVISERPDTVRELFAKFFRHKTSFHDFDALKDVSFSVPRGQVVGLIGRNGSGKSTTLKIIAGVYRPTAGRVEVNGTVAPLIELGAGFHSELTGRENILVNGLLMGYSKSEMLSRQQSIIDFADIGDFIDAPIKQYSSGMYVRLAFSVATEVEPDILVVDEILAVGDLAFQKKCSDRLKRFRDLGKTIILVTQSMVDIRSHCDRAIYLERGQIVYDGDTEEAVRLYQSEALRSEPMVIQGVEPAAARAGSSSSSALASEAVSEGVARNGKEKFPQRRNHAPR